MHWQLSNRMMRKAPKDVPFPPLRVEDEANDGDSERRSLSPTRMVMATAMAITARRKRSRTARRLTRQSPSSTPFSALILLVSSLLLVMNVLLCHCDDTSSAFAFHSSSTNIGPSRHTQTHAASRFRFSTLHSSDRRRLTLPSTYSASALTSLALSRTSSSSSSSHGERHGGETYSDIARNSLSQQGQASPHYSSSSHPLLSKTKPAKNIDTNTNKRGSGTNRSSGGLGEYDPSEKLPGRRKEILVGDPQLKVTEKEYSVTAILKELAAIQQQGPQKYCVLGTRHCSFLHQQIIELLAYALVLSGNHVYTSGAGGTHAATIRGALRAERPDLLTVVLPQSFDKQPRESQELLREVTDLISMPQNDDMSLDVASRICNSYLLSQTDQLISFAFHESTTVIEATKEAKKLDMLVTTLFLD